MRQSNTSETNESFVSNVEMFSTLDKKHIGRLARLCLYRTYSEGDAIIKEGGTGLGLFIITSGRVEVSREVNNKKVILATLEAGACVGELSLMDDKPRSGTVVATENVECLLITRDSFHKLVGKDSEIALQIASTVANKLREANDKVTELTLQQKPAKASAPPPTPSPAEKEKKTEQEESKMAPETTEDEEDSSESDTGFLGKITDHHESVSESLNIGDMHSSVTNHFKRDN